MAQFERLLANEIQFRSVKLNQPKYTTQTIDPGSLTTGTEQTLGPYTVTGAALGDFVDVAAPYDLAGTMVCGYVSAAGQVSIRHRNGTAGTVDLASGTWRIMVRPVNR